MGGHNDRVADRQEMEELLGNRRQGWHRVWLDHQGELELVESSLGFVGIIAREESRQEKELWPKSCPAMLHLLKTILFSVRVPVLSQNMYCTWPSSSVMLSALHSTLFSCTSSHISGSLWISQTCEILVSSMVT